MRTGAAQENWDRPWKNNSASRFTKKSWGHIRIMKQLAPYLKPGQSVLDAGCGSGFFSDYFLSMGCVVYSLDHSESALALTRRETNNRCEAYLKEDLLAPDLGSRYDERFDFIFTAGLFESLPEKDRFSILKNFKRMKTPVGIVGTFVLNQDALWKPPPSETTAAPAKPFTKKELLDLHAGMDVIETGGLNVLPFALSPERLLGSKSGMFLYCFAR